MRQSRFQFGQCNYEGYLSSRYPEIHNRQEADLAKVQNPFLRKGPLISNDLRAPTNSMKKFNSLNKYEFEKKSTYLPPSKLDIKQKLKELDHQSRMRENFEQEKQILYEYGPDVFRYSNYSTHASFFPHFQNSHEKSRRVQTEQALEWRPQSEYFQDSFQSKKIEREETSRESRPQLTIQKRSIRQDSLEKKKFSPSSSNQYFGKSSHYKEDSLRNPEKQEISFTSKYDEVLQKSKTSSFDPYNSMSYTSNLNGSDYIVENKGPLNIQDFQSSSAFEERSNYNSSFGIPPTEYEKTKSIPRSVPSEFRFDSKVYHRVDLSHY